MADEPLDRRRPPNALPKAPTGIQGLDEITRGGFPQGRPTLICGGPGSGKTLLAMEFLLHGALQFGEPGVFLALEETAEDLGANLASIGFDLGELQKQGNLAVDYVHVDRSRIHVAGAFDLDGLFLRLQAAVESVGARRVAIDTLETLFAGFADQSLVREEIRRLFRWLKERELTAVITAEKGSGTLTRHGMEEYVSDCVLALDHRVANQNATRRLRIVKYRGSAHGSDEYPFLIGEGGISVLPVTSLGLGYRALEERVSSGIPGLDAMLEGKGYYRGSSILITGGAGSGKTTFAAHFAEAFCARGERCLVLASEESPSQLRRNMRGLGLDLERREREGLLRLHASPPTLYGLEMHLVTVHKLVREFRPAGVVMDPITNFAAVGSHAEIHSMLVRMLNYLKTEGITVLCTDAGHGEPEGGDIQIISLIDTWLVLRDLDAGGERRRVLGLLKSRGMEHSRQMREFRLTPRGVELVGAASAARGGPK